jgi:ABC-type uncharacterized transport system permease subunit
VTALALLGAGVALAAGLASGDPSDSGRALSVAPSPAVWVAIGLYVAAAIAFGIGATGRTGAARAARVLLGAAVLAHGVDIGWRGVMHVHPAQSVRESLGFLAWIIAAGYLAASVRWRIDLAGVAVMPVVIAVFAAARFSPAGHDPEGLSALGRVHITLATVGVALFALAAALSAIYLVEERNLKRKRFDTITFKSGGAPLEKLDVLGHRLVWAGFPIFTVAVALGILWMSQRGEPITRPEYPLAIATWLVYAVLLTTRTLYGWRGRRAARLTLAGFACALLVLAIYLVRRIGGG